MTEKKTTLPPQTVEEPRPEKMSAIATRWIGSVESLVVHTILFVGVFSLAFFGFDFDRILLILTTLLSFEAIYLAIFIQMTVNRNTIQLHEVGKGIGEISEDIEDIQEDVEEISEDIEDIQEGAEEITDNEVLIKKGQSQKVSGDTLALDRLEQTLIALLKEIEGLKKK